MKMDYTKDTKYKNVVIDGDMVPGVPVKYDMTVKMNSTIINEYIPAWNKVEGPRGIKLLALIMAVQEGFSKSTKSYKTNNPGNIGNTDTGATRRFSTLEDGIKAQVEHLIKVAKGTEKNYPLNKVKTLPAYWSKEIANNANTYQMSPYLPGYKFIYTGKLTQFIKIYATGPRAKNSYLSLICSYFRNMGYKTVDENTTLQELLLLQ